MKKYFVAAAIGCLFAAGGVMVSAQASPLPTVSTCAPPAGTPGPPSGGPITASGVVMVIGSNSTATPTFSCSYTFTSTMQPQYGALTPNAWTITATHTYTSALSGTTYQCTVGDTPVAPSTTAHECTHVDASASGDPAGNVQGGSPTPSDGTGSLTGVLVGDTVTITVTYASVSQDPSGNVAGGIGTIAVGSPR